MFSMFGFRSSELGFETLAFVVLHVLGGGLRGPRPHPLFSSDFFLKTNVTNRLFTKNFSAPSF